MEIKSDRLEIASGVKDERGDKFEPEQQPVRHVMEVSPLMSGVAAMRGLSVPTQVVVEGDAIDFARGIMGQCRLCRFFDQAAFMAWKRHIEATGSKEERQSLNTMRAALLETGNSEIRNMAEGQDGEMDTEAALNACGICQVQTEIFREIMIMHPLAGCPQNDHGPGGEDLSNLFKPRNNDARNLGTAVYDDIMNKACGRLK